MAYFFILFWVNHNEYKGKILLSTYILLELVIHIRVLLRPRDQLCIGSFSHICPPGPAEFPS